MKTGGVPLAAWGLALIALSALGRFAFGLATLPTLLLAGAGAAAVLVGLVLLVPAVRRRMAPAAGEARVDPDISLSAVLVAAGATLALVGVAAGGAAFFWPGVGMIVLGGGGLVRETLAARAELAALDDQDGPPDGRIAR